MVQAVRSSLKVDSKPFVPRRLRNASNQPLNMDQIQAAERPSTDHLQNELSAQSQLRPYQSAVKDRTYQEPTENASCATYKHGHRSSPQLKQSSGQTSDATKTPPSHISSAWISPEKLPMWSSRGRQSDQISNKKFSFSHFRENRPSSRSDTTLTKNSPQKKSPHFAYDTAQGASNFRADQSLSSSTSSTTNQQVCVVTHVRDPGHFFVQNIESAADWNDMRMRYQRAVSDSAAVVDVQFNRPYLVMNGGNCYRAHILSKSKDNKFIAFCFDFGFEHMVDAKRLV